MSNGDLEVDNIYTSNAIRYRSRFGESFPDTLTLRFHLWGADRITSYDLYPFFVLDAAHTTSTEDRSSLQHFNIRPNISKDRVFIDINTKASMRMAYTIINAQGHKMQRSNTLKVTGQQNLELNIISYPSGTYFLMLEAEGQLFVKPFLKL